MTREEMAAAIARTLKGSSAPEIEEVTYNGRTILWVKAPDGNRYCVEVWHG